MEILTRPKMPCAIALQRGEGAIAYLYSASYSDEGRKFRFGSDKRCALWLSVIDAEFLAAQIDLALKATDCFNIAARIVPTWELFAKAAGVEEEDV